MKIKGLILFVALSLGAIAAAETWRLSNDGIWEPFGSSSDDSKLSSIGEAKQLVTQGKTGQAKRAFAKLQAENAEFAGKDFDDYVKAEILLSRHKWEKAAFAYDIFTDNHPQSPLYDSAMERQYQIATAFLRGQKKRILFVFKIKAYDEGSEIMNKIADKTGDAPIAKRALVTLAKTRENRVAYNEAYEAWAVVADKWPTGPIGKDALLGMARSLELDYRGPRYDSKVLESSKAYYAKFQERYPDTASEMKLDKKMVAIEDKLAEKELAVGDYYARTSSDAAACLYYQRIIKDWPDSKRAKQAETKLDVVQKVMAKKAQAALSGKKKFNWKGLFL